jgi:hypothetical protein
MKRYAFTLLFILPFLIKGYSQHPLALLQEQDVRSLLCHKWNLAYLEGLGKKISVTGKSPQLLLQFNNDGTLNESSGKKNYSGKWSYNHSTHLITTDDQDGREEYTIVTLSVEELVIRSKFKGVKFNMGMQRVN